MPEIEITDDQRERLRAVQEELEADVVGKYGHVRASDAVEYLLDRYETDEADASGTGHGETASASAVSGPDAGPASGGPDDSGADEGSDGDGEATDDGDTVTGDDDTELDAMMNLLDEHGDRWRESSASDARYEVELPDGTTEHARTKDDVRGLLFRHYR